MSTLPDIYGDAAASQERRYAAARAAFEAAYGPGEYDVFRAPGRVNLIGEHTDYNHGYVLPAALDRDTVLMARPRADDVVRLRNMEADYPAVAFRISAEIPPDPPGSWGNYARAAAQQLAHELAATRPNGGLCGLDGMVDGGAPFGVPRGAGLSSSSALTVAAAVALAHFNGWQPDGPFPPARPGRAGFARFCSEAEWYVGTRGGIMDHFSALLGRRDQALFLDCRPDPTGRYATDYVPLPAGYRVLVVNSGVHHENARRGQFNERVAACRAGVALLRATFGPMTHLRDVQDVDWADLEPALPEAITLDELAHRGVDLGDLPGLAAGSTLRIRSRCRHVWHENRRVLAAVDALRRGDVATVGGLLNAAHASARDDYEISCPELEALVTAAREVDGVAGARLTGAGWGGCIVAIVEAGATTEFERHVAARYESATGRQAAIFTCRAGPGAGVVE